jgi:hypothetical protein
MGVLSVEKQHLPAPFSYSMCSAIAKGQLGKEEIKALLELNQLDASFRHSNRDVCKRQTLCVNANNYNRLFLMLLINRNRRKHPRLGGKEAPPAAAATTTSVSASRSTRVSRYFLMMA